MTQKKTAAERPRVLIEDWLPAAAIGVECMRERGSASALAPHTYLHVWWARRPLTAARAAVLGSLLPPDFPRDVFERLIGFGKPASELVRLRALMDSGVDLRKKGGFDCERAFKAKLREADLSQMHEAAKKLWNAQAVVIDPMAGGGSIPLESARLGFRTLATEYNPVACCVLEATAVYPLRFGVDLAQEARNWGRVWCQRLNKKMAGFFPKHGVLPTGIFVFARTVPCPDTQHATPLVPDWHLLKQKDSDYRLVAEPVVNKSAGTWKARMREVGSGVGQLREAPRPTYSDGKGISLFTGQQIPADYIKAKAKSGEMKSVLYAIELRGLSKNKFVAPVEADLDALATAEREMARHRADWERRQIIPNEKFPEICTDERPLTYGMPRWTDMFSPR